MIETILQRVDIVGGVIVYFTTFAIKQIINIYLRHNKYNDLIIFTTAIIIAVIYGILRKDGIAAFEAFAVSQVIHILVKKKLFINNGS